MCREVAPFHYNLHTKELITQTLTDLVDSLLCFCHAYHSRCQKRIGLLKKMFAGNGHLLDKINNQDPK